MAMTQHQRKYVIGELTRITKDRITKIRDLNNELANKRAALANITVADILNNPPSLRSDIQDMGMRAYLEECYDLTALNAMVKQRLEDFDTEHQYVTGYKTRPTVNTSVVGAVVLNSHTLADALHDVLKKHNVAVQKTMLGDCEEAADILANF